MKSFLLFCLLAVDTLSINALLYDRKKPVSTGDLRVLTTAKIYSNLAEIIQPLGKLPLEFSTEDWNDIRADSVTLVGSNLTITQQTITEKKKSLNNAQVYVRAPSSSNAKTEFVKATIVDEKRNLVKIIDKDITKEPIFFTAQSDHIVYENEPPQTKYYVNFTYDTTDAVYLSYLRSNLNWKTRYQLNLFEETKPVTLISMADIRNDGESKIDIENAELLGGDINLQMHGQHRFQYSQMTYQTVSFDAASGPAGPAGSQNKLSVGQGEEVAGLYVFTINQPFSIEAKTNHLLPMFRPRVTVERYNSISKYFIVAGNSSGKGERSYRLVSDRFLSGGNCVIREFDRLVGETTLPDLAAKNKHDFSIGQDADIVYKENVGLISTFSSNISTSIYGARQTRTQSTYDINLTLKNYKKNRSAKVEYQQQFAGQTVKLFKPNPVFTQDGSTVKATLTLAADEEKSVTYKIEVVN
ncbi:unnamed protein product [Rotaria magnacalcarata]|uniref:DUF4139 domain-containing protein n=1 Tax=Rotaria magnacalcarata TaxID=392030 RepID=A0A816LT52_9BILA|nr:unnamed protein product [Rotaria magnacalcarata]CAF1663721.1 unnamed protein product [Rotaria magnacalcarata]CAF1954167.1 unnamed protein product [Rotaria magnacalcarata]CAF2060809.1 unnamed protein product [Rotaria magnacalcarata]CAF2117808.1 unnamed protein product [Rotaria magnacalcarata]